MVWSDLAQTMSQSNRGEPIKLWPSSASRVQTTYCLSQTGVSWQMRHFYPSPTPHLTLPKPPWVSLARKKGALPFLVTYLKNPTSLAREDMKLVYHYLTPLLPQTTLFPRIQLLMRSLVPSRSLLLVRLITTQESIVGLLSVSKLTSHISQLSIQPLHYQCLVQSLRE